MKKCNYKKNCVNKNKTKNKKAADFRNYAVNLYYYIAFYIRS